MGDDQDRFAVGFAAGRLIEHMKHIDGAVGAGMNHADELELNPQEVMSALEILEAKGLVKRGEAWLDTGDPARDYPWALTDVPFPKHLPRVGKSGG